MQNCLTTFLFKCLCHYFFKLWIWLCTVPILISHCFFKKKKNFPVQMRTAQPWPARWGWNEPTPTPGPSSPRCPKPVYKHQQQWTLNSGDHSRLCSLVNSKFSTWVNTCFGLKNLWIFYRYTGRLENELIWNFFLCFCENDTVIQPLYFLRNVWTAVVNIIGCKNCWDSDKSLAFLVFFFIFLSIHKVGENLLL